LSEKTVPKCPVTSVAAVIETVIALNVVEIPVIVEKALASPEVSIVAPVANPPEPLAVACAMTIPPAGT
jgi:hypothetical protein